MDSEALPVVIAFISAILAGLGGIAAMMKVNGDNASNVASGAKAVSEGAKTVVELMNDRIEENASRIDSLEAYVANFDTWADKLISTLDHVILLLPDALREKYAKEGSKLKSSRPRRPGAGAASVAEEDSGAG